jgi:tetratricopeptide (TPR) repeat protein
MKPNGLRAGLPVWLFAGLGAVLQGCAGGGDSAAPAPGPTARPAADSAEAVAREAADHFLKGDYKRGFQTMETLGEQPLTRILGRDMPALVDRVQAALAKATEASAVFQAGDAEKAAQLMREVSQLYPEAPDLRLGADYYQGYAAFDKKDYALYLKLAEKSATVAPDNVAMVIWLANAYGAQYALTGDPSDRTRADETMEKAAKLVAPGAEEDFRPMRARLQYRMDSRQIISQGEYDRRVADGRIKPRPVR